MIINRYMPTWVTVDGNAAANLFEIAFGVAGWIDTDISGSDVPASAIAILVNVYNAGGATGSCGAKRHGDTLNHQANLASGLTLHTITGQSSLRHVDFYRDAAQTMRYRIFGYLA